MNKYYEVVKNILHWREEAIFWYCEGKYLKAAKAAFLSVPHDVAKRLKKLAAAEKREAAREKREAKKLLKAAAQAKKAASAKKVAPRRNTAEFRRMNAAYQRWYTGGRTAIRWAVYVACKEEWKASLK